jgi:hypothetical protein
LGQSLSGALLRWIILRSGQQRFAPSLADRALFRAAAVFGNPHAWWQTVIASHLRTTDQLRNAAWDLQRVFQDQAWNSFSTADVLTKFYESLLEPVAGKGDMAAINSNETELKARLALLQALQVTGFSTVRVMTLSNEEFNLPLPADRRLRVSIEEQLERRGIRILDKPEIRPERRNRFEAAA